MSDPLDQLRDHLQGVDVNPLPAAEVRRRGDRMRRRRNIAAAVGSVAATALIATPLALWAGGNDTAAPPATTPTATTSDSPSPSPTTTPAPTGKAIPAGFPLAEGWPEGTGDGRGVVGPNRTMDPLSYTLCDRAVADPAYTDRLLALYDNAEDYRIRQLTNYADADASVAATAALVQAFRDCPEEEGSDGYTSHREVRRLSVGGESWAILETARFQGAASPFGATIVVVRVGSAVLVLQHAGHAGYPSEEGLDELVGQASEPIAAMCEFTLAGCGGGSTDEAALLGPDGFGALELGMTRAQVEATGEATTVAGEGCWIVSIADLGNGNNGYVSNTYGLVVIFAGPGVVTPEGIGEGATEAELRAAYPDLRGSADLFYWAPAAEGSRYAFYMDGDRVDTLQLELVEQECVH